MTYFVSFQLYFIIIENFNSVYFLNDLNVFFSNVIKLSHQ